LKCIFSQVEGDSNLVNILQPTAIRKKVIVARKMRKMKKVEKNCEYNEILYLITP
jgi:hypothetical protein